MQIKTAVRYHFTPIKKERKQALGSSDLNHLSSIADSNCCTAENNTTLESNYPPIKKKKNQKWKTGVGENMEKLVSLGTAGRNIR